MNKDETITITEAARRLNVSERTVYRLMKTGRLTRIYQYDNVRLMSDEVAKLNSIRGHNVSDSVSKVPESMPVRSPERLDVQLAEKDAQIAQLLARQKEMSQMLERLQEQLYELTRYVLAQAQKPPTSGFDWAFWRRGKKTDKEGTREE